MGIDDLKPGLHSRTVVMKNHPVEEPMSLVAPEEGNGGRTRVQYDLPKTAEQLQDLIEYRNMNFARGEMFKSLYRGDTCEHSGDLREARKVLWFAQREVARLERGS